MLRLFVLSCVLLGCDAEKSSPAPGDQTGAQKDAGDSTSGKNRRDSGNRIDPDADVPEHNEPITVSGDVQGQWCGQVTVMADVEVPDGEVLSICAGSTVTFAEGTKIDVDGTLNVQGVHGASVLFTSGGTWNGVRVDGTLNAAHWEIDNVTTAVFATSGNVDVSHAKVYASMLPFSLTKGGKITKSLVEGGTSILVQGGTLEMSDTTVDMGRPTQGADCIIFTNATANMNHVHVTGCHCPLHFNSVSSDLSITNSIFDGAAYALMIKLGGGEFTGNHVIGEDGDILDIGGSVDLNVSGNYYGPGSPDIQSGNLSQFKNRANYSESPLASAGPR